MRERTRRLLYTLVRVAASVLLISLLIWKVDLAELAALFASARLVPLILGLCAWSAVLLLSNERWRRLLLTQGMRMPFFRLLVIYAISFFFNNFLPAGLGMDITRTVYVAREKGKAPEVLASVLAERVLGMIGILLFALVALLFYLNTREGRVFALIFAAMTLATILSAGLLLKSGFLPGVKKRIASLRLFELGEKVRTFYRALQAYRKSTRTLLIAVLISLFVQAFLVLINYAAAASLGLSIPLRCHLVYVPVICILAMVPVSINGIGVREWGYVFLFGLAGLERGEALSLSLLFFCIGVVGSLGGGVALLFKTR